LCLHQRLNVSFHLPVGCEHLKRAWRLKLSDEGSGV
jgi:hypothetical protein